MAANPHYLLCGSNALLLVKAIPEREVLDIDFVCPADKFSDKGLQTYGDYGPSEFAGYQCYKVSHDDKIDGFYYNVFVHDSSVVIKEEVVQGIKIQSPDQILFWKKQFGRAKDKVDLGIIETKIDYGIPF